MRGETVGLKEIGRVVVLAVVTEPWCWVVPVVVRVRGRGLLGPPEPVAVGK